MVGFKTTYRNAFGLQKCKHIITVHYLYIKESYIISSALIREKTYNTYLSCVLMERKLSALDLEASSIHFLWAGLSQANFQKIHLL